MNGKYDLTRTSMLLASDMENEIKQTARKLMRLTSGGDKLSADQAADLAVFSLLTGLNPFNNECYHMDKVGPIPGIAGYRVKATDWLRGTSGDTNCRFWEEYEPATTLDADFDPEAGDVAWKCTIFDSVSKNAWSLHVAELTKMYHESGATFKEAREAAKADVGECPHWTAVGVVKGDEHFSKLKWVDNKPTDQYQPEKWDRNERAKKRAAKGCYRKGFPQVNIPDPEYGEVIEGVAEDVKAEIVRDLNTDLPKLSAEKQVAVLTGDSSSLTAEDKIRERSKMYTGGTSNHRGILVGTLEKITNQRNLLGQRLFGKPSSQDWSDGEVEAVWWFLNVFVDKETKESIPDNRAVAAIIKMVEAEQMKAGQTTLPLDKV